MRISDWSSDVCSSDLEPPHRQYVTLWCKAQPFDDCHRIVIARRQAWGAVWNIRHLISLRRKQHCQLACQGRRYSDHAMGPDQRRTLTEAKSEFGKRAPFRAPVIRIMMRHNNMTARSVEHRLGHTSVSTCRARWSHDHETKTKVCITHNNI